MTTNATTNGTTNGTTNRAVVLLSGGLDSATVLAIAREQGYQTFALSFDYGQRHKTELDAAARVAAALGAKEHRVLKFDLTQWGGSALTDNTIDVPVSTPSGSSQGIPVTYVPARNTIFLSLALAWAETLAFQTMARLATRAGVEAADDEAQLTIRTPIINMTKADIVKEGIRLGVDYAITVSCYQADTEGRACGRCDSCRLRRQGFITAGVADPTRYA